MINFIFFFFLFVLSIFCLILCRPKSNIKTCHSTKYILQEEQKLHVSPFQKKTFENKISKRPYARPYAIFTSAGDNTNFYSVWGCKNPKRTYDVWVVYYGDNTDRYKMYGKYADYIQRHKGSKFQNFYHVYQQHKEDLLQYEYIFITDDDIIITPKELELLFQTAKEYDLWICQPSFRKGSKVSWSITYNNPQLKLAYTNFVEVNTPVISTLKLQQIMNEYDPVLLGWGIDLLMIQVLGIHEKKRYAILHHISCINPRDSSKGGKRELYLVPGSYKREQTWKHFAKHHGFMADYKRVEHSRIHKS